VASFSGHLRDRETRYSAIKLECLAVYNLIRHFEVYLVVRRFTLVIDHKSVTKVVTDHLHGVLSIFMSLTLSQRTGLESLTRMQIVEAGMDQELVEGNAILRKGRYGATTEYPIYSTLQRLAQLRGR